MSKAMKDVCKYCGCTDTTACVLDSPDAAGAITCSWVDAEHTVCSAPSCMEKHGMTPLESYDNPPSVLGDKQQLMRAFVELVKLSDHYATLLNAHDGGQRKTFSSPEAWVQRLIETGTIPKPERPVHLWVNGVVSRRDMKPYVQFTNENGLLAQLDMLQARQVAMDLLSSAARIEADAMIFKFFAAEGLPEGAGAAFMLQFREFRAELDAKQERV